MSKITEIIKTIEEEKQKLLAVCDRIWTSLTDEELEALQKAISDSATLKYLEIDPTDREEELEKISPSLGIVALASVSTGDYYCPSLISGQDIQKAVATELSFITNSLGYVETLFRPDWSKLTSETRSLIHKLINNKGSLSEVMKYHDISNETGERFGGLYLYSLDGVIVCSSGSPFKLGANHLSNESEAI